MLRIVPNSEDDVNYLLSLREQFDEVCVFVSYAFLGRDHVEWRQLSLQSNDYVCFQFSLK